MIRYRCTDMEEMAMVDVTPDLLRFEDGSIVERENWSERRDQLFATIVPHEYGGMPPSPRATECRLLCKSAIRSEEGIGYHTYEIRSIFAEGELSFLLNLWIPVGKGPFPVVLDGDGCWRYFNDDIVMRVVGCGNIAATFNRTSLAADDSKSYRSSGLYRLFPDAEFGALSAWAWGYHRCVDALSQLPFVQADQIAVTGHSRGGKTVLLAGATDERIALTNPNDSGAGGSGLNHLKCEGAEVIDDFFRSGNIFWFGKGFAEHRGRDADLPYDQHFLHALVAPRLLLVNEAHGDPWANPPGSYAACLAAREAYRLLGSPDKIGWSIREGVHAHSAEDYETLLDFMDLQFRGMSVARGFQREVYCEPGALLKRPSGSGGPG